MNACMMGNKILDYDSSQWTVALVRIGSSSSMSIGFQTLSRKQWWQLNKVTDLNVDAVVVALDVSILFCVK